MKKKVGTLIEEHVFREAKVAAAADGIPLSAFLQTALQKYLADRQRGRGASVVKSSRGAIPADATLVRRVLEEEDGPFDV